MKIKVFKNKIFLTVLLLPFVKLAGMSEYAAVSRLFDLLFAFSAILIVWLALRIHYRPSKLARYNMVLQLYLFGLTVLKGGLDTSLIRNTLGVILAVFLMEMWLERNAMLMRRVLLDIFCVYTVLNILCGYHRLFDTYLFGQRTNLTCIALPMIIASVYIGYVGYTLTKRQVYIAETAVVTVLNIALMLKESVSTAVLALAISGLVFLLFKVNIFRKIKANTYLTIIVVYNFIVVVLQNFSYMRFIFENILGESMTLTGRLLIWSNALAGFLKSPIFGYGFRQLIVSRGDYAIETAYVHNNFLQFLVDGGLIGFVLFFLLLRMAMKGVQESGRGRSSAILLAGMCGMGLAMYSEVLTSYNYFYFVLVLMVYSGRVENLFAEKR